MPHNQRGLPGGGDAHSGHTQAPGKANLAALPLSPQDFGLDVPAFRTLVGNDCPLPFLLLAIHCCSVSITPSLTPSMSCLLGPRDRGRETHLPPGPRVSCPVCSHQMEPSTRAPFSEITQHLEQILEQLPEPAPLSKTPLTKAPLTYNQGKWA